MSFAQTALEEIPAPTSFNMPFAEIQWPTDLDPLRASVHKLDAGVGAADRDLRATLSGWENLDVSEPARWAIGFEICLQLKHYTEMAKSVADKGLSESDGVLDRARQELDRAREMRDLERIDFVSTALDLIEQGRDQLVAFHHVYRDVQVAFEKDVRRLEIRLRTQNNGQIHAGNPPAPEKGASFRLAEALVRGSTVKARAYLAK